MPEKNHKSVSVLYTAIGRGHPNYLDSTLRALKPLCREHAVDLNITSVFSISRFPALWGWQTIRKIYQAGPQHKILANFYNKVRGRKSKPSDNSILFRILVRDIRQYFKDRSEFILVAHPLLVQLLGKNNRVLYIHGEIAAPQEFELFRAEKIYVPLPETCRRMSAAGVAPDKIEITGLMLEPELENSRKLIVEARVNRIKTGASPVIACFNSGAYPRLHVENILNVIKHVLQRKLGRIILSAGNDKQKFEYFKNHLAKFNFTFKIQEFLRNQCELLILHDRDRERLTLQEIEILEHIDLLVMAAHERVNWCAGLEIPALILTPHYGNFARQNFDFIAANARLYENSDILQALESFLKDYHNRDTKLISPNKRYATGGVLKVAQSIINLLQK